MPRFRLPPHCFGEKREPLSLRDTPELTPFPQRQPVVLVPRDTAPGEPGQRVTALRETPVAALRPAGSTDQEGGEEGRADDEVTSGGRGHATAPALAGVTITRQR